MNEFKKYENSNEIELGGFAENEDDIDGGYDEFVAFNCCLAYDYYWAFKNENFEAIGDISDDTMDQICYWLNYDGKIGKDIESDIDKIKSGKMITNYARTLAEAIIAKKVNYLAFWFIVNGNDNPGLYELLNLEEKKILKKKKV